MSFAGTTTWADPFLRRSHDLALESGTDRSLGDGDVGRVRWDGDDLVETGDFIDSGRVVSCIEVWRRVAAGDCRTREPLVARRDLRRGPHG